MRNVIIGTAGHIDHGKTSLIRALTGRETDTLKEEKERGISVNLGFTFFDLPSKRRAGIIDVPGHEKFVKNMLAGISGVDVVLMVIAADEGIMPQTREHFEILQLLNVKKGIIVLTKIDMVQNDWLKMVEEDVKNYFKDTFLENAKILKVSSKTKEGINELIKTLDSITEEVNIKDVEGHFRLPVDRAFSVSGFGTVVTGTIIGGNISVGEVVEIYPSRVLSKVRSIQVHGESKQTGETGQRCAINLSNIKLSEIKRGYVVSKEGIMEPSLIVDCKLYYLKSREKPLVNRQRVRLYHGTEEILCRVILLDREELKPGEEAFVQLRLESKLTSQRNDRFVIRSYSPMITIGGGSIINPVASKVKRFNEDYIEELKLKESGKTEGIIENAILNCSSDFPDIKAITKRLGKNEQSIEDKINELVSEGKVLKLTSLNTNMYIHTKYFDEKVKEIQETLKVYHKENPLKVGIGKEELKNKIFNRNLKQKVYDEFLEILKKREILNFSENYVYIYDFSIQLNREQVRIKDKILKSYKDGMFNPPKVQEISTNEVDKNMFKMVYEMLINNGELIKLTEDCILYSIYYNEGKEKIINYIKENGKITTPIAREILNSNRKYTVALLEHMDNHKITKRVENDRVLF